MRVFAIAMLFLIASACAAVSPTNDGSPERRLALAVRNIDHDQVVTFDAMNIAREPIMVTEAFGYDFYFGIEIRSADGGVVNVPKWELTRAIRGKCLGPGAKRVFRVPLKRWSPVIGTDAACIEEPCSGLALLPDSYLVRVVYRPLAPPPSARRCASIAKQVVSDWVQVDVPGR